MLLRKRLNSNRQTSNQKQSSKLDKSSLAKKIAHLLSSLKMWVNCTSSKWWRRRRIRLVKVEHCLGFKGYPWRAFATVLLSTWTIRFLKPLFQTSFKPVKTPQNSAAGLLQSPIVLWKPSSHLPWLSREKKLNKQSASGCPRQSWNKLNP